MKHFTYWLAALIAIFLAGCADKTSTPAATTPAASTIVTGSAIAGAVTGNLVVRTAAGTQVATATITAGAFSLTLPASALSQELDFEVTGTYVDEVSANTVTLTAANPLALRVAAGHFTAGTAGNAPITFGSTIIRDLVVNEGKTLATATTDFYSAFGYTPDMTATPFAPSSAAPAAATTADKAEAFRAGMFSQFASDIGVDATGMPSLAAQLAADLSDGALDGNKAGNPLTITITGGSVNLATVHAATPISAYLQMAASKFAGSTANVATVTAPATALPPVSYDTPGTTKRITLSTGAQIDVTLTTPYAQPFKNGFWTARVTHQIKLVDVATNQPIDINVPGAPITAISQMPLMWMLSGHHHSAPFDPYANMAGAASGIYTLDTYYLMPSAMMDGTPMGLWEYTLQLTESSGATANVVFHPKVMMPMGGDLFYGSGSNAADTWTGMLGTTPREYRVWLNAVTANPAGGHDLTVAVSTVDMFMVNMMMKMEFVGASTGQILHGPLNAMNMRPAITIANITVEVSTDNGTTWQLMNAPIAGAPLYQITGLTGLTSGVQNTVQIRLMVDIGAGLAARVDAGGNNPTLKFTAP